MSIISKKGNSAAKYIGYLKAFSILSERLNCTEEEIAAWIRIGKDHGGLRAYTNVNEFDPPPAFYFNHSMGDVYLMYLMDCHFLLDEIDTFKPRERYITGKKLMECWKDKPGINVEAFIRARMRESRLNEFHPIFGLTQWNEGPEFPDKDDALFALSEVKAIENEDFPDTAKNETPDQRRQRLTNWIEEEKQLRGRRGALQRTADKEKISRQRLSEILNS